MLVPEREEALKRIFQCIMDELGFNIFTDETRAFFVEQAQALRARGAEGIILGCTEIELLIQQRHIPELPVFQSAELHIAAVAAIAAGRDTIDAFVPP